MATSTTKGIEGQTEDSDSVEISLIGIVAGVVAFKSAVYGKGHDFFDTLMSNGWRHGGNVHICPCLRTS